MGVTVYYRSTAKLVATLVSKDGELVTGATVTADIEAPDGSTAVSGLSFTEQDSGEYIATVAKDDLGSKDETYTAKVTATSGPNERYAEVPVLVVADKT